MLNYRFNDRRPGFCWNILGYTKHNISALGNLKGSLQVTWPGNIYKNGLRQSGKSPLFCIHCPSTVTRKGVSQTTVFASKKGMMDK